MVNVAIAGLSRIGRVALRIAADNPQLDILAINDSTEAEKLLYLLKNDAVYGCDERDTRVDGDYLYFGNNRIRLLNEWDTLRLPWRELGIDVVFECSGGSCSRDELARHIEAGARHVILSAADAENEVVSRFSASARDDGGRPLLSTESYSTQCIAPVAEVMARRIGVVKAATTTLKSFLPTRGNTEVPFQYHGDGAAGMLDLCPVSNTTAAAIARILPHYAGRIDGMGIHVPMASGSVSDMTFVTSRPTTVREVNDILREESQTPRYHGIMAVDEYPVVSSDVMMNPHASLVDLSRTRVVDGDLVKIISWIDNEWGFASQMVRQAGKLMQ